MNREKLKGSRAGDIKKNEESEEQDRVKEAKTYQRLEKGNEKIQRKEGGVCKYDKWYVTTIRL